MQFAFFQVLYKLFDEFVFRGAYFAIDKAQGRTADHIKQAAKLNCNRPQSLRPLSFASRGKREAITPPSGAFPGPESPGEGACPLSIWEACPEILYGAAPYMKPG